MNTPIVQIPTNQQSPDVCRKPLDMFFGDVDALSKKTTSHLQNGRDRAIRGLAFGMMILIVAQPTWAAPVVQYNEHWTDHQSNSILEKIGGGLTTAANTVGCALFNTGCPTRKPVIREPTGRFCVKPWDPCPAPK
ncbi:hypothetical protein [Collimonas humicola]|uniref:hypothetical protein n=1 Tax=Collimonas humicola TaxID=2825886 RepID=UPI001B8BE383|nr:hypothetical protein [Collimonas humicola]